MSRHQYTQHNLFSEMLDAGHGVRVQMRESYLNEKLDLDPNNCPHRMVTQEELYDDGWSNQPEIDRLTEELSPLEAGPWGGETWCEELNDWVEIGWQTPCHPDEYMGLIWDVEFEAHRSAQRTIWNMEAKAQREMKSYCLSSGKQIRDLRFNKICAWLQTMPSKREAQLAQGPFYYKLGLSRKRASRKNKWWYVYLTAKQANFIKNAISVLKTYGRRDPLPMVKPSVQGPILNFEAYVAAYKEPVSFFDSLGNTCHHDHVKARFGTVSNNIKNYLVWR